MATTKTKTHDEFLSDSQKVFDVALQLLDRLEKNRGEMGIVLKSKEFVEGKEVMDEDGNPVITPDGSIKKYPDSYFIEFSNATFGTYKMRVDKEIYEKLVVGERYYLTYQLEAKEIVAKSKSGFEYVSRQIVLKPIHFENFKDVRVAS